MVEPMTIAPMPDEVRSLLPLARVWGIPDDIDRSMKIEGAPIQDLRELVEQVAAAGPSVYAWLDAAGADPSDRDYIAVTSLTMAADEARVVLRNQEQ